MTEEMCIEGFLSSGKKYEEAENRLRRTIWEANLKKIQHHNIRAALGEFTYTLGMNKYGDMVSQVYLLMNQLRNNQAVVFVR
jgi:Cathepsin propeptide inhibitor domain (I29)